VLSPEIGDAIAARYRVGHALGHGGMSSVYLADDLKHGRKVAVKIMRPEMGLSLAAERFEREIAVTARLSHPNILPLLDSGDAAGTVYYVMPFVEGESLRDRLAREKRIPIGDALRIAIEVADALGYAHDRDVIHRDIKPENILLSAGHAVVADFGIARAVKAAGDQSMTQVGVAIGTPIYMSPEQLLGEPVDGRADVYALGCVLFEMLVGHIPFEAATPVAILTAKITGTLPVMDASIPGAVTGLLQRALSRDADDRFQSAHDFSVALELARAGLTSMASAPAGVSRSDAANDAIAVLAFASMSPDAADEHLGDGIAEAVMHALGRVKGLRVIARTSAFAFKHTTLDTGEIGRRLHVRRLVEGSVRRSGSRIRVTASLVETETSLEVWSERFDRSVDDLFDVEDEIAASVANTLSELLSTDRFGDAGARSGSTTSFAVYEDYLKGRQAWALRTESGLRASVGHLERAIAADPGFPLAHAALADTFVTLGMYGMSAPSDVMPRARDAADVALALRPELPEALTARACVTALYDRDLARAEREFRQAIAAGPHYSTAHQWFAMNVLVPRGRFDEARASLRRGAELDPLSPAIAVSLAAVEYYARRYEAAIAAADATLQINESFAMGHYFRGLALEQAGRLDDAAGALTRAASLSASAEINAALGHLRAASGDAAEARGILTRLEQHAAVHYVSPVLLAQIRAGLGESDVAVALLTRAKVERAPDYVWVAVRPVFDSVRERL
jgi:eukaryotic-like serine/threonine-protein kinase